MTSFLWELFFIGASARIVSPFRLLSQRSDSFDLVLKGVLGLPEIRAVCTVTEDSPWSSGTILG